MRCSQARPLLLAGDPVAEGHLETCQACGAWLDAHDPVVLRIRVARPPALPVPASLRPRLLARWARRRSGVPSPAILLGGVTGALVAAAAAALLEFEPHLVARVVDLSAPILDVFASPRALMLDNLPALLTIGAITLLALSLAAALYRELGQPRRRLAR